MAYLDTIKGIDYNTLKWIALGVLILVFAIAFYALFRFIRRRQLKRIFALKCNIYLKKGGKEVVIRDIRENSFQKEYKNSDGEKKKRLYFIIKEAIQDEIQVFFWGTRLFKFIDFHEDIAYPFIMGFIKSENPSVKYLGSERANQFFQEKIWDKIGGLGKSENGKILMYVLIAGVIVIAMYFLFFNKPVVK